MSSNTIIRAARNSENPYAQIARAIFEDDRLSWRAKGLMGYLLSRKDDWKVYVGDLQKRSTDGRDACYKGLDELGRAGYLERIEHREKGRIKGTEYVIHELPDSIRAASWKAVSGKTVSGEAVSGNTVSGKSATSNKELKVITEEAITEEAITEEKNTPPLAADAAVSAPSPSRAAPEIGNGGAPDSFTAQTKPPAVGNSDAKSPEQVPGAAAGGAAPPVPSPLLARLMAAWNDHRAHLPAAEVANPGREKAALGLRSHYGSADAAVAALIDAARQVASEDFWRGKGWGLDNLLPKVAQKAEAWRSRGGAPPSSSPATPSTPTQRTFEETYS